MSALARSLASSTVIFISMLVSSILEFVGKVFFYYQINTDDTSAISPISTLSDPYTKLGRSYHFQLLHSYGTNPTRLYYSRLCLTAVSGAALARQWPGNIGGWSSS